jgi:uncharacterized protein YjbI with pentapeptide repeats
VTSTLGREPVSTHSPHAEGNMSRRLRPLLITKSHGRARSGSRLLLTRTDLRRAALVGANLQRARLRGASLARAWLFKTDLRGVDLREADLRDANLREAIADLTTWWPDERFDPKAVGIRVRPDLENADLRSSYLQNTDLTGVSLRGARANAFTEWPDGFDWRHAGVIMDDEPAL